MCVCVYCKALYIAYMRHIRARIHMASISDRFQYIYYYSDYLYVYLCIAYDISLFRTSNSKVLKGSERYTKLRKDSLQISLYTKVIISFSCAWCTYYTLLLCMCLLHINFRQFAQKEVYSIYSIGVISCTRSRIKFLSLFLSFI